MPLTDAKIRSLKPQGKGYKATDANGLYLFVTPAGAKSWRLNFTFDRKQKTMTFGAYPAVSLQQARKMLADAKLQLGQGINPIAPAPDSGLTGSKMESFESVARRWFKANQGKWVVTYHARLRSRLEVDAFPSLGSKAIDTIGAPDVLEAIRTIEARGAIETGRRVLQLVSQIFRFAIAEGLITADPARDIGAALAPKPAPKRRSAMPAGEMPDFMAQARGYPGDPITRGALLLVAHTIVRTGEIRFAEWAEFEDLDGKAPLWRIPAARMKMRRDHLVPLSRQAAGIVREMRQFSGGGRYLFPSPQDAGKAISENALIFAMYRLGYHSRATVHGFRSTASTWLNEREWNRDAIELALAHVDGSIRGVYNSALLISQRREMLQAWSDYVEPKADPLSDLL